jgi:hypothetical protein
VEEAVLRLKPVAEAENIVVNAPIDGYFSIFNSPYYSHRKGLAIDVYPSGIEQGSTAYSPVEGKVKRIYEFKPPKSKFFETPKAEQLIIVESEVGKDIHIRLLHIDSKLKVGDVVSIGDELGSLVRSGFFDFWTAPHIHVEVRKNANLIRAKGSEPVILIEQGGALKVNRVNEFSNLKVISVHEEFTLLRSKGGSGIGGVYGLGCTVGRNLGILDGGISHYPYGGAYLGPFNSVKLGDVVRLGSAIIGKVEWISMNVAFFKRMPIAVYVNEAPVKGISLFLSLTNHGVIKVVPKSPGESPLQQGNTVRLSFK